MGKLAHIPHIVLTIAYHGYTLCHMWKNLDTQEDDMNVNLARLSRTDPDALPIRCSYCGVVDFYSTQELPNPSGAHSWRCEYCPPSDPPVFTTEPLIGPVTTPPLNTGTNHVYRLCAWCDGQLSRFSEDYICRPCLRSVPLPIVHNLIRSGMLPKRPEYRDSIDYRHK